MKKSVSALIAASFAVVYLSVAGLVLWMFSMQYNVRGVSHFLVMAYDADRTRTYLGTLEDHDVYIEKFDPEHTVFLDIRDRRITVPEAIEKRLVSIEDWRRYAFYIRVNGEEEILTFEDYEIAVTDDTCVIRQLTSPRKPIGAVKTYGE